MWHWTTNWMSVNFGTKRIVVGIFQRFGYSLGGRGEHGRVIHEPVYSPDLHGFG